MFIEKASSGPTPLNRMARRLGLGLLAGTMLSGCGAVYYPVYAPSDISLLIRDDERSPYETQIVNLTITSAQEANARWPYQPRPIPSALRGDATPLNAYTPTKLAQVTGPVDARATTQSNNVRSVVEGRFPIDEIESYKIGSGDILTVYNAAETDQGNGFSGLGSIDLQTQYQVDQQGRIFIPNLNYITVKGLDVTEARDAVLTEMQKVARAPIAVVNITEFNSQFFTISGKSIRSDVLPISMVPLTLQQAVLKASGPNQIYDDATVELYRTESATSGTTLYKVPFQDVAYGNAGSDTRLRDRDRIVIVDPVGVQARDAGLDRTIKSVELDQQRIELQESQQTLTQQRIQLDQDSDKRDQLEYEIAQERLALEREKLAQARDAARLSELQFQLTEGRSQREADQLLLARERAQREADQLLITRERAQRETDQLIIARERAQREAAQLDLARNRAQRESDEFALQRARSEREAQAFELQRLRDQREAQNLELQTLRAQREQVALELQKARSDRERSALEIDQQNLLRTQQELEIRRGQFDLQRDDQALRAQSGQRDAAQLGLSQLNTQERIGALERDHVFVAGEVDKNMRVPMPYGQSMSLADALYQAQGFDPVTGNPGGIHVIRTDYTEGKRPKVYVFKLDARNIANMAAATVFKMRPDDILYVTPQPVTNWSRTLTQLLGGTNALVGAAARGI